MNPIAIDFWKISITWYSLFILFGVFVASIVFIKECKKYKINEDFANNLIFWVVILGIIGARAYYILFNLPYYTSNPGEIFKIWNGGLAIHGGIIVGLLFVALYSLKYKIRFFKVTDMAVVGLIIAQAIGRWGNFFNGEAHGPEVTRNVLESIKIIPDFVINGMKINDVYYHPTFYYEFIWCLLGFIVLLLIRKFFKYIKVGQLTGIYLMWYSVGRYFIEALRTDSLMFNNIKVAQLVSIALFVIGLILIIIGLKGSKFENRYDDYELEDIKF
jgi:phosphatidylglycerol:prolipoprotein diacylglycerol transferase